MSKIGKALGGLLGMKSPKINIPEPVVPAAPPTNVVAQPDVFVGDFDDDTISYGQEARRARRRQANTLGGTGSGSGLGV